MKHLTTQALDGEAGCTLSDCEQSTGSYPW